MVGIDRKMSDQVTSYPMSHPFTLQLFFSVSCNLTLALNAHINVLLQSRTK